MRFLGESEYSTDLINGQSLQGCFILLYERDIPTLMQAYSVGFSVTLL
jgi:hypothetical protein